jgi:DNA-binding CsgD family transcriptional regulator
MSHRRHTCGPAGAPAPALPRLRAGLTERELEILRWLAAGRTKGQIAAELVISPSTVHTHMVHIYAKCGVSTRAGLAMFAMRHGLAAKIDQQSISRPGAAGLIRYAFTVTAAGKQVAMNMHHYWKFRDGKACYVRSSEDTAQVTAALSP